MGMIARIDDLLFIGVKGTAMALSRRDGREIWRTKLKGSAFTNVRQQGRQIVATTQGEIFCLDAATGKLLWNNPLRGMGFGLITIADAGQVPPAAQQLADDEAASSAATMHTAAAS